LLILLIGPSGVGKSDYGEHVSKTIPECQFFDLDSLVRDRSGTPVSQLLPQVGNDRFLELCQQEVNALLKSNDDVFSIVAVGAGALQSDHALAWLTQHPGPTLAIVAAPEEVYKRGGKRNHDRTLGEFIAIEYSETRKSLYDSAEHLCSVTGLSVEEARNRFTDMIRMITADQKHEC